jgi:2-polyprenyl-6-methoxyphenol hydroxylase-like FAD-dependent oxidoreductase
VARVVVVGGGIGGLACALLLAPRGHDVTVLDRDPPDLPATAADAWARWPRKGVPQFRHIHLFNARGRKVLAEEAPEVLRALQAEGAGEIHLGAPDDDELVRLTCRRTTYELVLRRAVLGDKRVRFIGGARVVGLQARGNRIVAALTGDGVDWPADLVVDASGRRSDVATWLAAAGRPPPTYEEDAAGSVGHTRWYRLRDGDAGTAALVRADLGYAAGVVAPADDGMFCVAFGTLAEDPVMRRLRDTTAFDAAVAAVPSIAEWTAPERAVPETGVLTMADRANRLARLPPRRRTGPRRPPGLPPVLPASRPPVGVLGERRRHHGPAARRRPVIALTHRCGGCARPREAPAGTRRGAPTPPRSWPRARRRPRRC